MAPVSLKNDFYFKLMSYHEYSEEFSKDNITTFNDIKKSFSINEQNLSTSTSTHMYTEWIGFVD